MKGKTFIDTNILVYSVDKNNSRKRDKCRTIIKALTKDRSGVISIQVLQEFYSAVTRKLGIDPLTAKEMMKYLHNNLETIIITPELIEDAVDCSIVNKLSFWDALIVVTSGHAKCRNILTEDMASGSTIRGVTIVNPV